MGPPIILDKSAVEAIGSDALMVQSRYFHTVITPVLVWEVCGDIEKTRSGRCDESKVRAVAAKARPFSSIATMDWRKIVGTELARGVRLEMKKGRDRQAVIDGAHKVPVKSGGYGVVIEQQPEEDALMRWADGQWTASDRQYAHEWKRITKNINLERFQRRFKPLVHRAESPEELRAVVDGVLNDPSLQPYLLNLLLSELQPADPVLKAIRARWLDGTRWQESTRYSGYAIRTILTFYLALGSGFVGTRATNRVDLEYLLYLPFTPIFVSGDEGSHGKLTPLLIEEDQTFVRSADFRAALQEEADRAARLDRSDIPDDGRLLPEGSLIRNLWIKAWGERPPRSPDRPEASERSRSADELIKEFQAAADYVAAHPEVYPKRPSWPGP